MAVYRSLQCAFWDDSFSLDLTPEDKYFYVYLLTNPKSSQCGIYELPYNTMMFHLGYNRESVVNLIKRFVGYGKILYCEETKEVMVLNWTKYNWIDSSKVHVRITKELQEVKHRPFVDRFVEIIQQLGYRFNIDTVSDRVSDTVSIQDVDGSLTPSKGSGYKEKDKDKEEDQDKDKRSSSRRTKTFDEESVYLRAARFLLKKIQEWKPDFKPQGDIQKWADDVRKMIEIDNRSPQTIADVINWCTKDPFWQTNILSPGKLRKQFDTLEAQMIKARTKQTTQHKEPAHVTGHAAEQNAAWDAAFGAKGA